MSFVFYECNVFFELSFVFCEIIINQLLSQVNNIRFFLFHHGFHRGTQNVFTFLIESYFRNGSKVEEVWVCSVQNCRY
jgi:hypothetical protein